MDPMERLDAITNLGYEEIQPYRHILVRLLNEDEMDLVALYVGYNSNYRYDHAISRFESIMEEVAETRDYTPLRPIIKDGRRLSNIISTRFLPINQQQEYSSIVLDGELFERLVFEELDELDDRLINYANVAYDDINEDDLQAIPDTISLRSIAAILVYIGFLKDYNYNVYVELLEILIEDVRSIAGKNVISINRIIELGEEVIRLDDFTGWPAILLANPDLALLTRELSTELQDRMAMTPNVLKYIYEEVEDEDNEDDEVIELIRAGIRIFTYEWVQVLFMETNIDITARILAYIGFVEGRERTPPLIALIRDAISRSTGVNIDVINRIREEGDLVISPYISDNQIELIDAPRLSLQLDVDQPEVNILDDVLSLLHNDRLMEYAMKGYRILIPEVVKILLNRVKLYALTDILIYVGFLIKNNLGVVNKVINIINNASLAVNDHNTAMIDSLISQGRSAATLTILDPNVKKSAFKKLINQLANESPEYLNKKIVSITAKNYRDMLNLDDNILSPYDISLIRAILSVTVHNNGLQSVRDIILYVNFLSNESSYYVHNIAAHRIIEIIQESIRTPGDINAPNILQHLADYGKLLYNNRANLDDKRDILVNINFQALNHPYEPGYIISIENKINKWTSSEYPPKVNSYIKNGYRLLGTRTDEIEGLVPEESIPIFLAYIGFIIEYRMNYRELLPIIDDIISTNDQSMIDIILYRGNTLLEAIKNGDDRTVKRFTTTSDIFHNIPR